MKKTKFKFKLDGEDISDPKTLECKSVIINRDPEFFNIIDKLEKGFLSEFDKMKKSNK